MKTITSLYQSETTESSLSLVSANTNLAGSRIDRSNPEGNVIPMKPHSGASPFYARQLENQSEPDKLMPEQLTDVGQAKCLAASYGGLLRYSTATQWMTYDGTRWSENGPDARRLVHKLTEQQLTQAQQMVATATKSTAPQTSG